MLGYFGPGEGECVSLEAWPTRRTWGETFTTVPPGFQGLLQGCNSMCAGYLFQQDKQYDVAYDTGDKAIQCGRHVDIFKFWLMWKAKV